MRPSAAMLFLLYSLGFASIIVAPNIFASGMVAIQLSQTISIQWPQPGQAILGNIEISGTTRVDGYKSSELLFGYANDTTNTWFLIATSNSPVENGVLAAWDTTVISDGDYSIKLSVTLLDGAIISSTIQGVRVRNYSPIEPDTPLPVIHTSTPEPHNIPVPSLTSSPIPPTATPLPTNPIILTQKDLVAGIGKGALIALGFFIFLGAYLGIRSASKK